MIENVDLNFLNSFQPHTVLWHQSEEGKGHRCIVYLLRWGLVGLNGKENNDGKYLQQDLI